MPLICADLRLMPGAVYVLIDEIGYLYCGVNWRGSGRQAKAIEDLIGGLQ
jgi:hypothetical protein